MDCKICVAKNCDCLCKTCERIRAIDYVAPLDITDEDSENWDFRSNVMSRNDYLDYNYKGKV